MARGKYIENTTDGEIISGSTSKDTIENHGVNVFVSTGGGNDSIYNDAGADDLAGVTIDAGKGKDTIDSDDDYVSLNGGVGKDFINSNGGDYVTLVGGKGNDTLVGEEGSAEIYQYAKGDGNDVIFGFDEDDTFHITEGKLKGSKVKGDDFILKVGSGKITLKGAADIPITILDADGHTSVINDGSMSFAGQSIGNSNDYTLVSGTDYDDTIRNTGYAVTIDGGNDADKIYLFGDRQVINYASGDGRDTVYSFDSDDTLNITSGTYTTTKSGDDVIINVGSGSIRLVDVEDDPIKVIDAAGVLSTINVVEIVETVASAQTISNYSDDTLIIGTDYDDTIINRGEDVTIVGGDGNDLIRLSGDDQLLYYANGDGNDTLYDFDSDDTLNITSGTYTTTKSGDDVIINVGSGSIRLVDVEDDPIKMIDAAGVLSTINVVEIIETVEPVETGQTLTNWNEHTVISGTAYADSIRNFADDVTISTGAGDDFIFNDEEDVSINAGAGDDEIYTASDGEDVTINGGAGNDFIFLSGNRQVINYAVGEGNDTVEGFSLTDTLNITSGTFTTSKSGDDVIVNVGSGSIIFVDIEDTPIRIRNASGILSTINVIETVASAQTISNYNDYSLISGSAYSDSIYNAGEHVTINAGDGNDTVNNWDDYVSIGGGSGDDYIINNNLTYYGWYATINGGSGNDTILSNGRYDVIQYASGDGNDVVYNFGSTDTLNITSGTYTTTVSGNDLIVNVGAGSITLRNLGIRYVSIRNQYGTMSTIDAGAVTIGSSGDGSINNIVSGAVVSGTNDDDYINNYGSRVTINALDGDDTVDSHVGYVSINGGAGDDIITNTFGMYVTMVGGAGYDSVYNVNDNCVIKGDSGRDTVANLGRYSLIDGDAGDDFLFNGLDSLPASAPYSTMRGGDGNDEIYNFCANSSLLGGDDDDTLTNISDSSTIYGGDDDDMILSTGNYNKVYGGDDDDIIGIGNATITAYHTTINGGEGNDTIDVSHARYNLIQYASSDGNDQIVGFGSGDTLHITLGSVSSTMKSGTSLIVNIGSGSLRLLDVAGSNINVKFGNEDTRSYYVPYYSNQLPADDYWFEPSSGGSNELDELIRNDYSADETAIGDLLDSLPSFDRATREVSTLAFDRHRSKK